MALRLDRLSGRSLDPAEPAATAATFDQVLHIPQYLSALVEQALREPAPDIRRALLDRIAEFDTPIFLPLGYQADLGQLRDELAEVSDTV